MKLLSYLQQDRLRSLIATVFLLSLVMTLVYPTLFPTWENISQLLLNLSIDTIVAVGMMILMIGGMFDLSVGSIVALSGGLCGYLMYYHGVPVTWAILAGLLISLLVGLVNGYLIAYVGINPMIQTLAMMGIARGLALLLSGAGIQNFPYAFNYIGQVKILKLQSPVWYMFGLLVLAAFCMHRTVFLRRYYYIGSNEKAARLAGIQVERMKTWAFVISALLAGIAGILLSSRLGAALSTSGRGLELRVITAVILGGASLSGGQGKIWGAFWGAALMGLVNNLLILSRVSGYWQEIILGLILVAAVAMDRMLQQWKLRNTRLAAVLVLFIAVASCEAPPRPDALRRADSTGVSFITSRELSPDEEYVMVTTAVNLPLYVNHDQAAFIAWAKQRGVRASILGPAEWDVPAQIAVIEQVIASKPAGLLINGTDPGIAQAINRAIAAGIPTVVYDSPIPGANAHCFIGSDWYEMGRLQGERMAKLIGGKGKVACLGILGMKNMEAGFQGFRDAIKKYPDIVYLGAYDDKANVETAARITADLLSAHPDLAGLGGFDSNSGPGMALAVKEAGRAGRVKITTVDAEPEHLRLVQEGVIQYLVGQKRELFTHMGAQLLFDMRHQSVQISRNDPRAGVIPIPRSIITGSVEIDRDNVGLFLQ